MPRKKKTSGGRKRFNFVLTDSERDRVVAGWLDAQPNASEALKALIYATVTGQAQQTRPRAQIVDVPERAGVPEHWGEEEPVPPELDRNDPKVQALRGAVDT